MPIFRKLTIMHAQSTTDPSQTPPMPSNYQDEPQYVDESQDQQKAVTSPKNDDILTRSKFFEVMENFQKELLLFKPP